MNTAVSGRPRRSGKTCRQGTIGRIRRELVHPQQEGARSARSFHTTSIAAARTTSRSVKARTWSRV